ncbi:MAG: dihydrodipicolinate synthase family protein [Spirochaetaceae bacterium]|nr:MAG: dihydrodipicolinate synthase family protein [Spirochaetaceae bacterium]
MKKQLLELRGIITVLNTPFTEEDAVDLPSLRKNVRYALECGVAGFLVPAMASEVDKLSREERRQIVEAVLEENRSRVPVIGGASAATAVERRQNAAALIELGCQGVLASIPFQDEEQYERDVRALDALKPGFLMIQDWDFQGYGLTIALITRLFEEVESFRCLKVEVVPAGVKYSQVLSATGGKLHVSGGWAVMQIIEALDRGVHAFMPTGMHELYTRIYDLYREGRRDEARLLFERLLPVLAFANQHLDISIHFFKRLLYKQGIYATPRVREPILPFDEVHEKVADQLIGRVIELCRQARESGNLPK